MPRLKIIGASDFIDALWNDESLTIIEKERGSATDAENDRLGFELGNVAVIIGVVASTIEALSIARWLMTAALKSKQPKLEIVSSDARISVDLTDRSEAEVLDLVRATLPFAK